MKATEAPEKIYVHRTIHLGLLEASEMNITGCDIEYIRTNAFIEKAARWIYDNAYLYVDGQIGIKDFKKYMEEE